jgi:hypothetical protein
MLPLYETYGYKTFVFEKSAHVDKIEEYIIESKLDMPDDLIPWSYRWRCYIYSNVLPAVFGTKKITDYQTNLTIFITHGLREEHSCNWVREQLYPVDPSTEQLSINWVGGLLYPVDPSTKQLSISDPINYQQLLVMLFFNKCLLSKNYIVDDYMIKQLPFLKDYIVGDFEKL